MTLVPVFAYSRAEKVLRLVRVVGSVGNVGNGSGFGYKLSLAVQASFPFLRICWCKAYGGWYV